MLLRILEGGGLFHIPRESQLNRSNKNKKRIWKSYLLEIRFLLYFTFPCIPAAGIMGAKKFMLENNGMVKRSGWPVLAFYFGLSTGYSGRGFIKTLVLKKNPSFRKGYFNLKSPTNPYPKKRPSICGVFTLAVLVATSIIKKKENPPTGGGFFFTIWEIWAICRLVDKVTYFRLFDNAAKLLFKRRSQVLKSLKNFFIWFLSAITVSSWYRMI